MTCQVECYMRCVEGIYRYTNEGHVVGNDIFLTTIDIFAGMLMWSFLFPLLLAQWTKICIASAKMERGTGDELKAKLETMTHRMHLMLLISVPTYLSVYVTYFIRDPDVQVAMINVYVCESEGAAHAEFFALARAT